MNIHSNNIPIYLNSFTIDIPSHATKKASLDLQNSIKQGNTTLMNTLIASGQPVNAQLPNGQMPLHFAVLENNEDIIASLLKHNADPQIKDAQGLSAMDHAILMKNDKVQAQLIAHQIGGNLKDVQEQIKNKASALNASLLQNKVNQISSTYTKNLNDINQAAFAGKTEYLTALLAGKSVNDYDSLGLTPIHYAILGNHIDTLEKLFVLGANTDILTSTIDREGDSLLHFAAVNGSKEMINCLIGLGVNTNVKNSKGETALHYAAAKENIAAMETLIRGGADPHLCDNNNISPLALIGISAFERDPLAISLPQTIIFLSTCAYLTTLVAVSDGWKYEGSTKILNFLDGLMTFLESMNIFLYSDSEKNSSLSIFAYLFSDSSSPLNFFARSWTTAIVAETAFKQLKKCSMNIGYRKLDIAKNIVVHSINTVSSIVRLYMSCINPHYIFGSQNDQSNENTNDDFSNDHDETKSNDDNSRKSNTNNDWKQSNDNYWRKHNEKYWENYWRKHNENYWRQSNNQWNNNNNRYADSHVSDACSQVANVNPLSLKKLSIIERLNYPDLVPECFKHALLMINPEFTEAQLKAKGKALYNSRFKEMMKTDVHPDKACFNRICSEKENEAIHNAYNRLVAARDTLNNHVKQKE